MSDFGNAGRGESVSKQVREGGETNRS